MNSAENLSNRQSNGSGFDQGWITKQTFENPAAGVQQDPAQGQERGKEQDRAAARAINKHRGGTTINALRREAAAANSVNAERNGARETEQGNNQQTERNDDREKTRAEQKLESVEDKLRQIEQALETARGNKERLEAQIDDCEIALTKNLSKHTELATRAEELRTEVRKTKRRLISRFTGGLKLAKNLALGRHAEVRQALDGIREDVDANEKALTEQGTVREKIVENERRHEELTTTRDDAIDDRDKLIAQISRLERERDRTQTQAGLLKEEVASETRLAEWKNAQAGIKSEMGTNNIPAFRANLLKERTNLGGKLNRDLDSLNRFGDSGAIQTMLETLSQSMGLEQQLDMNELFSQARTKLQGEYDNKVSAIDMKLDKIDQYFPTWQQRIKNLRLNQAVSGALSTIKRKALLQAYSFAN